MRWVAGGAAAALALVWACASPAQTLHASYAISLFGLPIGSGTVEADVTGSSYRIDGQAHLNALASLIVNSRGASEGHGAIVGGRISPSAFATTAVSAHSTRTIRMALKGNAVVAVDIAPPFGDSPDRVPLRPEDTRNIIDPVGAFVFPAPKSALTPAACDRTLPIFDGYTRFDLKLSFVGERKVAAKGYKGEAAVCAVRYVPIAGHRKNRPATKFMAENRDLQIWLVPVPGADALAPFRVSIETMVGMLDIEATEFSVTR